MKIKNLIVSLAISTLFFGCGKPEPPAEEAQPVKAKPKRNYTLDNKTTPPKQDLVANVTVVDADTGLSIEGAKVRGRIDADNQNAKFIEGIEIGDGGYYLPKKDLKGSYYVGASAKDYPGNASYTPAFPYEIRLTRGETVTVSGEIIDEFHRPVTKGIMNLRVDKDWGKQWPKFYLCSTKINQHGKFKLENIPANMKDVYAKYECVGEPAVDFKDQSFEIENEDIYLKLQLPSKLIIKGKVIYSSGEAVSGAWVWVENVVGDELNSFNKFLQDKRFALDKVAFCTLADGEFELRINTTKDKYSIKAYHPLYLPAYQGPYSDDKPPPEMLELVITTEGARLIGKIINNHGAAVTNCSALCYITIINEGGDGHGKAKNILLDIEDNGEYISSIVPLGINIVDFEAPGYYSQRKPVTILKNELNILDVKFKSKVLMITGTVYNAETKLPLAGVSVKVVRGGDNTPKITDDNGKFVYKASAAGFKFSVPGEGIFNYNSNPFVDRDYNSSEAFNKAINPKFYLSPSGSIRLFVTDQNGQPLNGNKISIRQRCNNSGSGRYLKHKFLDGELLLTNLFSNTSSVNVSIKESDSWATLMDIRNIKIIPGEEVFVCTNLPPLGNLSLNFKVLMQKDLQIELNPKTGVKGFHSYSLLPEKKEFKRNNIDTNMYLLKVGTVIDPESFLSTNIFISQGNTTRINVDNTPSDFGVIKGSIKTITDQIVPCEIEAEAQENRRVDSRAQPSYDHNFIIEKLPKKYLYKLEVNVQGSATNIVVKDLKADGPPVDIVLPEAFAITGNIIDEKGNPLKVEIGINGDHKAATGEFKLYPVFPGSYKVNIKSQDYVEQYRDVIVNKNVDLGDIVISDKGIKVSGVLVSGDNKPLPDSWLVLSWQPNNYKMMNIFEDGSFSISGIPIGVALKIKFNGNEKDLGIVSVDLDLGEIKLSEFKPIK